MPFGQLKIPLKMPLKFPLDTTTRSKNIVDTPVSAICIHLVCFELVQFAPQSFLKYFFNIANLSSTRYRSTSLSDNSNNSCGSSGSGSSCSSSCKDRLLVTLSFLLSFPESSKLIYSVIPELHPFDNPHTGFDLVQHFPLHFLKDLS